MINDAYTIGSWASEADSAAALDRMLETLDLWHVHKEVPGVLTHPRPRQIDRTVRIDRILIPNTRLCALGWTHGAIGIEIKRSGMKIGHPIAQAMDYGRSVWSLPAGIKVWLDFVFIWPMPPQHGPVASILAQNRIGSAYTDQWNPFRLRAGQETLMEIRSDGAIAIGHVSAGRKVGSR